MGTIIEINKDTFNDDKSPQNWAAEYAKMKIEDHSSKSVIDHPDKSVTYEKFADDVTSRFDNLDALLQTAQTTADAALVNIEEVHKEIPNKVSQLENDTGYLTEHQDISGKADTTYVDSKISEEAVARDSADGALQSQIDEEKELRASADTNLQTQIDSVVSSVDEEITARDAVDTYLQNQINDTLSAVHTETEGRISGDAALQSQIDEVNNACDVLNENCSKLQDDVDVVYSKVFGDAPKTWADVQSIVRSGKAAQYFNIGDQFIVEKLSDVTASIGESTGISAVTVDKDKFVAGCGEVQSREYLFSYHGKSWRNEVGEIVDISDYGIAVTGTPKDGDYVIVTETSIELVFDVIGIDCDTPSDANYTHSMTIQSHYTWFEGAEGFDAREAAWYVDAATYPDGLAAGTYQFTVGGSTYNFTLTKAVPVGGQICCSLSSAITYAAIESTTELESVAVKSGASGVKLPDLTDDDVTNVANAYQRSIWGSNNWKTSGIRQWLNTNKDGGTWWEPKTVFDRPTNASTDGFLKGIDPAFLEVVGEVTKTTYNSISEGKGSDTSTELFFFLSFEEVKTGNIYPYYQDVNNRIKYDRYGAAHRWWLRNPVVTSSEIVNTVLESGSASANNASNASQWACPACVIV